MRVDDLILPFAVSTMGDAPTQPAIVLPGGPCRGPEYLAGLAGLGEDRALVVLHPRGTPRSGGLSRGWWTDASDVVALADALDLDTVDIVGHSAGTRLALATAAQHPDRVRSLALLTPPASWLTGTVSDAEALAATFADPAAREAFAALQTDDPQTESEFTEAFLREAPATYAHWTEVERSHAEVGTMSLAAALAWFTDIPDAAADRIRSTPLPPTLVVGGDRDLLTGLQPVRDYAAVLGADVRFIDDCGHYPWIEQPAAFRRILAEWLTTRG
ncbi:alpha/beta hydrolase [Microbacterium sp. BWT-B31]|uniref:alpha/beta fold hydrolase n=1 Tax=Microbacterium sp. BWT-B31 TaxID=3232072 RepID=UPI0035275B44